MWFYMLDYVHMHVVLYGGLCAYALLATRVVFGGMMEG